jgi:regulator of chromosome condensation
LWTWGTSDNFAIGRTTTENINERKSALLQERKKKEAEALVPEHFVSEWIPGLVTEGLEGTRIVKVACGDCITVVLTDIGTVYQCGVFRGGEGNIRASTRAIFSLVKELEPYTITDIACGNNHVLAATSRGHVFAWGNGEQLQFGRRVSDRHFANKSRLLSGTRPERIPLEGIKAVAAGGYHSFAIDVDGQLWAWGMNSYGQTCVGRTSAGQAGEETRIAQPMHVSAFTDHRVKNVACGEHFSLVLLENGDVWSCGRSDSGQLGLSEAVRAPVEETNEATKTSAVMVPTKIPTLQHIVAVDAATAHAVATDQDGQAYCWGFGEQYALGTASEDDEFEPAELHGQKLEGWEVKRVAASGGHTIILATQ